MSPRSEDAGSGLQLSVLGQVTAAVDGVPVDLGGPRQRAVLALLVLARGALVPAEQLTEALWGEAPPPTATASLHTYISHLRRRLQPDRTGRSRDGVIASRSGGYALNIDVDAVDSWRFERMLREAAGLLPTGPGEAARMLQEALELWRGPALSGHRDERWAEAEIARLSELRAVASEQVLAARLQAGEAAVLVPELEVLVGEEPLREERWRLLVLAHYRSGRQADALAALRRARAVLADELGVDPGPALRALEGEVLAQSPTLDAVIPTQPTAATRSSSAAQPPTEPAQPTEPTQPPQPTRPGRRRRPDVLVDREDELGDLLGSLADAMDGQGRLVLVQGPAGIGKSRLLSEVRQLAAGAEVPLLSARCSELEREFGFGAVRQLFEPALGDVQRRPAMLAGAAAAAEPVFDVTAAAPDRREEEASFATLHGLYWLTVNLTAEQPLVLVIDDLHWCDRGSLRFLHYLVRRLEGLPLLIVATLRTAEQVTDAQLIDEIAADPATVPVFPGPLSFDGLTEIIRSRLSADADVAFCTACYDTTSGNPLLLRQLLRALEADGVRPDASHADVARALGSRAISSMVLLRLNRLPAAALSVARALAVLGDGAALPVLAALAGLDESAAADATAALARAEVLRPDSPCGFVHALVGEAVYRDLAPGERELLHDRAARLLDRSGAPAEQVAAQLLLAPRRADGWAVDVLRRAAAAASRRGVPDGAVTYLRRALDEPPAPCDQPAVLLELARAEVSLDGPAALTHLEQAYSGLEDPDRRAAAALVLARTMVFAAPRGRAAEFARTALAELPAGYVDERQGLVALERISGHMHGLDPKTWGFASWLSDAQLEVGEAEPIVGDGPGARMLEAERAWELMCLARPSPEALRLAEHALGDEVLYQVDNGLLWVVATTVQDLADVDVMPLWETALRNAYERGSLFSVLSVSLWRGFSLVRRGDLPEAEQSLRTAMEQLEMWQEPGVGSPYAEALLVQVLLEQDRLEEARSLLARGHQVMPSSDGGRLVAEAQAQILLAEGRHAAALTAIEHPSALVPHLVNPAWRGTPALRAEVLHAMGRTATAIELLEVELERARCWGAASTTGRLLRLLGEIRLVATGGTGGGGGTDPAGADNRRAIAELEEAEALLDRSPARLEHGKALRALGEALLVADRPRALGHLLAALEIAEACSALRLRRQVAEALAEAGVEVPDRRRTGVAALTSTERRVARMTAEGVGERDLAQALYVTPRAVERHLTEVRRTLGISSDDEIGPALVAAEAG